MLDARLPCVSIAAFGAPAVPAVKSSTATSESSRATVSTGSAPPASSDGEPSTTAGSAVAISRSSSGSGACGFSGTATAPAHRTPRYDATNAIGLRPSVDQHGHGETPSDCDD